jgi:rare lipoprotein A
MRVRWALRLLFWLIAAVSLAACAETQLALHVTKKLQRVMADRAGDEQRATADKAGDDAGAYKIGQPYQIQGVWYYPGEDPQYRKAGIASWYGEKFHGRRTANGEIYDMNALTAAHKTLPMPVQVRVTNLGNGRSLVLRVNDRGPFVNGRIIDVSRRAAQLLGFQKQGTAKVLVVVLDNGKSSVIAKKAVTPTEQKTALPALPLAKVTSQNLAPPPGAKEAQAGPVERGGPTRIASAGPAATANPGAIAVTRQPVGPSSIFVQAGAFALAENAYRLRARLAYIGPSSISNVFIKGQEMFRVRMGPLYSVEAADKVLSQVLASGINNASIIVE